MLNEEEDMESWIMHHQSLALQAMENTFSQALCTEMQLTPIPGIRGFSIESPYGHTADDDYACRTCESDERPDNLILAQSDGPSWEMSCSPGGPFSASIGSSLTTDFVPRSTICNKSGYASHFRRGLEKLIPRDYEAALKRKENVDVEAASPMKRYLISTSIQKNCHVNTELEELSTLFDRLFLSPGGHVMLKTDVHNKLISHELGQQLLRPGPSSTDEKHITKRRRNLKKPVNMGSLLINCVTAITNNDNKMAEELLRKIRLHSSPSGNGPQRLGHYFAEGLKARLSVTGPEVYSALDLKSVPLPDVDFLKVERSFAAVCPFGVNSYGFASEYILKSADQATVLHIIDFGIRTGLQWVSIVQRLSTKPGGPPKLRITGIEDHEMSSRPEELTEKAGRLLGKYCQRYNVPFEYNGIAQEWATIKIEDLKLKADETISVNCTQRFEKLLDETNGVDSPRNVVLKLIRKMNPDVFVHTITNGSHGSPLFFPRCCQAISYYSKVFDMLDTVFPPKSMGRLIYERNIYGREIVNVVACEGLDRVERPETYEWWQLRTSMAGFRQLPLDKGLIKAQSAQIKSDYHEEFTVEEDGQWMVQAWKGWPITATCCWTSASV